MYSHVEKIVIAPQIVVYKNIFKHSKEIINLLKDDRAGSFFTDWYEWYGQGFRKDADFNLLRSIDTDGNPDLELEKSFLLEVNKCMSFIREDYLNEFKGSKGIWPSFIDDWDNLIDTDKKYWIDFFRYDMNKLDSSRNSDLLMDYHVDEFPIPGENKVNRHVATVNFYLNDEYSGGEICVYDSTSNNTYMYKPSPGDAVIMPSTEPFYHGVRPFDLADRYFLRAFIDYQVKPGHKWENKYAVKRSQDELKGVSDETSFVEKDLQIIKLSSPSNVIEVKG